MPRGALYNLSALSPYAMYFDGDDDDDDNTCQPEEGDYNMGDEIGERVGEGHDPIEDSVT